MADRIPRSGSSQHPMTRQARPAARQVQSPLLESAARLERVANGQAFGQNAPSRPAALAALQMSMARFEMNRELDTQDQLGTALSRSRVLIFVHCRTEGQGKRRPMRGRGR